jgi:hypothetical protein
VPENDIQKWPFRPSAVLDVVAVCVAGRCARVKNLRTYNISDGMSKLRIIRLTEVDQPIMLNRMGVACTLPKAVSQVTARRDAAAGA